MVKNVNLYLHKNTIIKRVNSPFVFVLDTNIPFAVLVLSFRDQVALDHQPFWQPTRIQTYGISSWCQMLTNKC